MRKKKVEVEMYNFNVILNIGSKVEIEAKLRKERPKFKMGNGLTKPIKKGAGYDIYIDSQSKKSILAIFTHELVHVVDRVSEAIGASEEKELRAYLAGFLWQKFETMLLEAESKRKLEKKTD